MGGALFALNVGYISPDILSFGKAGDSLVAALIGGLGTLVGPVLGTFLFVYAQANFNFGGNIHLLTGGAADRRAGVRPPGGITGGADQAVPLLAREVDPAREGSREMSVFEGSGGQCEVRGR